MTTKPPSNGSPTSPEHNVSVLFVCLGNICRSPMAEAVFADLLRRCPPPPTSPLRITNISSSGTDAYHALEPPDPRTIATLKRHGITGYDHAAKKVVPEDFYDYDYLLAMDAYNFDDLRHMRAKLLLRSERAGGKKKGESTIDVETQVTDSEGRRLAKVVLFGEFGGTEKAEEVGDPYYGRGESGFEKAYEQLTRFSRGFLDHLLETAEEKANDASDK